MRERYVYCICEKLGQPHPSYFIHYKLEILERPDQAEVNVFLQSKLAKEKITPSVLCELRKRLFKAKA